MSARAKITMSPEEYLAGLRKLEAETNKSASKMENSFKKYGTSINKAGIAMRYVSSEMGAGAVAFGRAFQVLAGGKIAVAVAAITGAIVALKEAWDKLTVSAEEYNSRIEKLLSLQKDEHTDLKKTQEEEDAQIERLVELAKKQDKTAEQQKEQRRLAELLAGKYEKLGVNISDLTGDYETLKKAIAKVNEEQKKEAVKSLEDQRKTVMDKNRSLLEEKFKPNAFVRFGQWMNSNGPKSKWEEDIDSMLYSPSSTLAKAQEKLSNPLTTQKEIDFWGKVADAMREQIDLTERLNKLKESGYETDREERQELQKGSEESGKTKDAKKAAADENLKDLENLAAEEAKIEKERLSAIEKERKAYADMLTEQEKKRKQLLSTQVNSLKFAAMRALGMDREADIEEALTGELGISGVDPKTIIEMVDARRALEASMQKSTAPELYAPRVNSLIARGGSAAPVKMPEVEKLQTKQLDAQNKTNVIAQRILNSIDAWTTY